MGADDATDPQIRQIRRVLYRRRGWAWTGVAGLITTAICAIIVASLAVGLTGFAAVFVFVIVLALVVLTLLAVCLALVDTARLRRAPTAARASAAAGVSHHPWYVLPFRYPPHRKRSWYTGCALVALVAASALVFVPGQVNGLAYLSGAGSKSVFHPVDHSQSCAKGSCTTMTDGFLVSGGGGGRTSVTWPDDVPLNQPFTVRAPVWAWGLGRQLFDGDSEAATALGTGLFVEVVALIFAVMAARAIEDKALRGRRRPTALPERSGRPDAPPSPEQATPTGDESWFPWDQ